MRKSSQPEPDLSALVERLAANRIVEEVILFGSRARGDAEPMSDYDLLVVVADADYYKGISTDIRRSLASIHVAKDIVVAKRSVLLRQAEIPGTVYYEAMLDGVKLHAAA